MKKLELKPIQYHYLEQGFKEWLDILGYNANTVYNMPNIIREFFYYLEQKGINPIQLLRQQHIKAYHDHICKRSHERRGGGLSEKYILMQMQAIEKLLEYLHYKNITTITSTGIRLTTPQRTDITVLTMQEYNYSSLQQKEKQTHPCMKHSMQETKPC